MIEFTAKDLITILGPLLTWLALSTWKNRRDMNVAFRTLREIKKKLNLPEGFTYERDKDDE